MLWQQAQGEPLNVGIQPFHEGQIFYGQEGIFGNDKTPKGPALMKLKSRFSQGISVFVELGFVYSEIMDQSTNGLSWTALDFLD